MKKIYLVLLSIINCNQIVSMENTWNLMQSTSSKTRIIEEELAALKNQNEYLIEENKILKSKTEVLETITLQRSLLAACCFSAGLITSQLLTIQLFKLIAKHKQE